MTRPYSGFSTADPACSLDGGEAEVVVWRGEADAPSLASAAAGFADGVAASDVGGAGFAAFGGAGAFGGG